MKKAFFQLIRFGVVGTANTAIDALVYVALTRSVGFFEQHYLWAAVIAFIVSGINSFFWNKKWTFKDRVKYTNRKLLKFYIAAGVALAVNAFFLWFFVQLGVWDVAAKVIGGVCAGLVNFSLQKFWTFPAVVKKDENKYND
ncbi:MAG: GtrA family protein [Candidatus Kerfeldbacteria bacterium]